MPSPFPAENLIVRHSLVLTTRWATLRDDEYMERDLGRALRATLDGVRRSTLILFPSFDMLARFHTKGMIRYGGRELVVEERGGSQADLAVMLKRFRSAQGSILLAVFGGRVAEGLDFPAGELEMVLIVGVPYPKPSARSDGLVRYADLRGGRGWDLVVHAPTARKLAQGIGRLIRGPEDRGAAIIFDMRADRFADTINGLKPSDDPVRDAKRFFAT